MKNAMVQEAKAYLLELIESVLEGEDVVISQRVNLWCVWYAMRRNLSRVLQGLEKGALELLMILMMSQRRLTLCSTIF